MEQEVQNVQTQEVQKLSNEKANKEVKVNKFTQLVSDNGDSVLKRRAGNLATTAEIAQQTLINDLKNKKATLELQLATLTDLAPNNKLDLTPSSESWDPNKWVTEVQNTKQQLYNLGIQLQLAEATYNEFFKV
jgi:hypothetical protein